MCNSGLHGAFWSALFVLRTINAIERFRNTYHTQIPFQ